MCVEGRGYRGGVPSPADLCDGTPAPQQQQQHYVAADAAAAAAASSRDTI